MSSEETTLTGAEQLRILIQESQKEYDQIQRELREIDVLIRQSSTEVEKLAQRNNQIGNRVRQMEMNLDTYPRDDIKDLYSAASEAQMRHFMMRGQLEQFQNRQQGLQQQSQRLLQVVELASQIAPEDVAELVSGALPDSQRDIVRVIEAQEKERHRLARQMHDGPAQSLTNLMLQAEICERLFDNDPIQARVELGNLKNALNVTFQKIREFIVALRPMMLDDLGLVPAVKQHVQTYEEKAKLSTNFAVMGRETRLPPHIEAALFRMIQELLSNVETHAHATHVQVVLDFQDAAIVATVEDDGSGFNIKEVQSPVQRRRGLGLSTIQERTEMMGGQVIFESRIGRGSKIRIEIPVATTE
jgi:two-component system sensor histidine kinase DegS